MSERSVETRLEDLETKLCLAEDLLDALNRSVYHQQQALEALRVEVRGLREQLRESSSADEADATHRVPPHY